MPMFAYSRYRYCTGYKDANGVSYLDEREPFRYRNESDNTVHEAVEGDTWWGLAHLYFDGLPRPAGLFWILCEFQPTPVVDPTIRIKSGASIVVPSLRLVKTKVFNPTERRFH